MAQAGNLSYFIRLFTETQTPRQIEGHEVTSEARLSAEKFSVGWRAEIEALI
jgi:hypothetical protein